MRLNTVKKKVNFITAQNVEKRAFFLVDGHHVRTPSLSSCTTRLFKSDKKRSLNLPRWTIVLPSQESEYPHHGLELSDSCPPLLSCSLLMCFSACLPLPHSLHLLVLSLRLSRLIPERRQQRQSRRMLLLPASMACHMWSVTPPITCFTLSLSPCPPL